MQHTPQLDMDAVAKLAKERRDRASKLRAERKREQKRIGKTKRIIVK